MEQLKIGWAKREISIDGPVSIPGQMYMRISEGIMDPLYATALCIDGGAGADAVIFCSLDVTVMRGGIMQRSIARALELQPDIPEQAIIMNATHTHSSCAMTHQPEKSLDGLDIYPAEKWMDFAVERIAEAIAEAWSTRQAGGVAYGYGYAVVSHSRRTVYKVDKGAGAPAGMTSNGHAVMYGKTKDPEFSGYESGADHFVNLLYTFDRNNALTGILINVPCPSQTSEHFKKLSADYWNEVRQMVAETFGSSVYVLPQCAAAGDLSPRILHFRDAQVRRMQLKYGIVYDQEASNVRGSEDQVKKCLAERYDIAERILTAVKEVYGWASKDIRTHLPLQHERKTLALRKRLITEEEMLAAREVAEHTAYVQAEGLTPEQARVERNRYDSMIRRNRSIVERFTEQQTEPTMDSIIHVLRIGDMAFSSNRFEYYMDFMHRIQARSPFLQTAVIQLAGDEGGSYLATAKAQANKGYGSSMYENQVGEEGGSQIVEETLNVLQRMKAEQP